MGLTVSASASPEAALVTLAVASGSSSPSSAGPGATSLSDPFATLLASSASKLASKHDDGETAASLQEIVSLYFAQSPFAAVTNTPGGPDGAAQSAPAAGAPQPLAAGNAASPAGAAALPLPEGGAEGAAASEASAGVLPPTLALPGPAAPDDGSAISVPPAGADALPAAAEPVAAPAAPELVARNGTSPAAPPPAPVMGTDPATTAATPALLANQLLTSGAKLSTVQEHRPPAGTDPPAPTAKLEQPRGGDNSVAPASLPPPPGPPQTLPTGVVRSDGNADITTSPQVASQVASFGTPNLNRPKQAGASLTDATAAANAVDASVQHPGIAAADAAAPAPVVVDAQQPLPKAVQQVAETVIERLGKGGGEAHIRLDPPELGGVTIRVQTSGNQVHVEVHTERPEATALLREHAAALSSLLEQSGLALANVNIGFSSSGFSDSRAQYEGPRSTPNDGAGAFADILGADPTAATAQFNRTQAAYNPDGLHLYRI